MKIAPNVIEVRDRGGLSPFHDLESSIYDVDRMAEIVFHNTVEFDEHLRSIEAPEGTRHVLDLHMQLVRLLMDMASALKAEFVSAAAAAD
jgi:hypothetical protein